MSEILAQFFQWPPTSFSFLRRLDSIRKENMKRKRIVYLTCSFDTEKLRRKVLKLVFFRSKFVIAVEPTFVRHWSTRKSQKIVKLNASTCPNGLLVFLLYLKYSSPISSFLSSRDVSFLGSLLSKLQIWCRGKVAYYGEFFVWNCCQTSGRVVKLLKTQNKLYLINEESVVTLTWYIWKRKMRVNFVSLTTSHPLIRRTCVPNLGR
jgi:hypothetical protein